MSRISQRSVNIRELERACGNLETAQGHMRLVITSFTDAIQNIEEINKQSTIEQQTQVPDLYYKIAGALLKADEILTELNKNIIDLSKEM